MGGRETVRERKSEPEGERVEEKGDNTVDAEISQLS